jgi:S-adenosylmethionine:tRNA ribosyltransferase-isomerase
VLKIADFDYTLPPDLIAQQPANPRDHSRLLSLNRQTGEISHHHFYDLPELLNSNTVIVRNNTKVLPARIYGTKETGGKCEILLVHRSGLSESGEIWECMTKPGLKPNQIISFTDSDMTATCRQITGFTRLMEFSFQGEKFFAALDKIGHTPIPPYIHWHEEDETQLRQVYQTTYAKITGSVAAPTAGLHFTPEVDAQLRQRGIAIEEVTLHVGLGTFLPLQEENITAQQLHPEHLELSTTVAATLNAAKAAGKKILAVGTTTTRLLESCVNKAGQLEPQVTQTTLMISPPYQYRFVDHLITNFHLPKSSLLMLLSAFVCVPNTYQEFSTFGETVAGRAYSEAIKQRYHFYSFGDAMLVR